MINGLENFGIEAILWLERQKRVTAVVTTVITTVVTAAVTTVVTTVVTAVVTTVVKVNFFKRNFK